MTTRLVFLAGNRDEASPYLIVDKSGVILGRGVLTDAHPAPKKMRTIIVVPGAEVLARWIELPARKPAQALALAATALKDEIAVPRDQVHIALGIEEAGVSLISVIDRTRLEFFLQRASELGLTPDIVVPDHLLLPAPEDDALIVIQTGGRAIVRGRGLAFTTDLDLLPLFIGDRGVQKIENPAEAEVFFAAGAYRPPINLRQQDFGRAQDAGFEWRDFRRAAALAAILLTSPLLLWGAEAVRYESAARSLETRAAAEARRQLGSDESGDPILQVKAKLADARAGGQFLHATAALAEAVSRIPNAELEDLSYSREGAIAATLIHMSADDIAGLARSLEEDGLILEEDASRQDRGHLVTAIRLRVRP